MEAPRQRQHVLRAPSAGALQGAAGATTWGTARSASCAAPVALDVSPRGGAEAAGAIRPSRPSPARRGVRSQRLRAAPDETQGAADATTWGTTRSTPCTAP
eukprot:962644-Pyramimonas_sp.AAC.1